MVKARQRSRRKDPDQEAIVQVKDEINDRMSKLISLLKEVKKGLNGGPAPTIGISEKINLTQPLPDSVSSAGDAALQELSAIIQGIHRADQMQDTYSNNREQRLIERSKKMEDLKQQTIEAAIEEELMKVASNSLTRTWAHIIAPFSFEKGRWERLSLLRSLARIDNSLKEIEDQVLSDDPAILNALHIAKQLYLDAKSTFFDVFRKQLTEMVGTAKDELKKLEKEVKDKDLLRDYPIEPLRDDPVQMPGMEAPKPVDVLEKVESAVHDAEKAVQDIHEKNIVIEKQLKELTNKPIQIPNIPDSEPPEKIIEPSEKIPERNESVIQDELVSEDIANPPEEPGVDIEALRKAMRSFIWKKSHMMYQNIQGEPMKYSDAPELWLGRLHNIWSEINKSFQVIRSKPMGDNKWISSYLDFVKAIGDWTSNTYILQNEIRASELKSDFTFGSTINEENIKNQVRQYVQSYWDELQEFIPLQESLISEGSDRFTRWLKRIKTHMSWGRDKNLRLLTASKIRETRKGLQAMLNNLEKRNINFRLLITESDAFYNSFIDMYNGLADLAESYNSRVMMDKSKRKYKNDRIKLDTIREYDIRSLRNIVSVMSSDRTSIHYLDSLESQFSEIQTELERVMGET
jgi:hypothetical protein